MRPLSRSGNLPVWITYVFIFIVFTTGRTAHAQQGAEFDYSLLGIECQIGVLGDSVSIPIDSSMPSVPDICRDASGPSTFGHAFVDIVGFCSTVSWTDHVTMSVSWSGCHAPVIGESVAGFGTNVAEAIDVCGPEFHEVGEIFGKAKAINFLLNTEIEGVEGWADCTGGSSPAIPPLISEC